MPKQLFSHRLDLKKTKSTLCGVYNEEQQSLTISGLALSHKVFSKALGRKGAIAKVSIRPFMELPCRTLKEANKVFLAVSKALHSALCFDPTFNTQFKRILKEKSAKTSSFVEVLEVAQEARVIDMVMQDEAFEAVHV